MFHRGAELDDPDGLLEGEGDVSRVARFLDVDDLARDPVVQWVPRPQPASGRAPSSPMRYPALPWSAAS